MGYVCVYPSRAMPLWTSFSADFFARWQDEMSAETPGFSQGFSSHHADVSLGDVLSRAGNKIIS